MYGHWGEIKGWDSYLTVHDHWGRMENGDHTLLCMVTEGCCGGDKDGGGFLTCIYLQ